MEKEARWSLLFDQKPYVSLKGNYATGETTLPIYRHGKQTSPISFQRFERAMEHGKFISPLSHKSFLAFLYWIGCRKTEALMLTTENFKLSKDETRFKIWVPTLKGGERKKPLQLPLKLPYVNLIAQQLIARGPGRRIWPFTGRTAIRIVKRALGVKYYPHFLRLNRATKFLDDPTTTIPEMKAWFGWKRTKTIDDYIGYSTRHIEKQAARLKAE